MCVSVHVSPPPIQYPPGLYTHYRSLSPPPRNPVNAHCSTDTHRKRIEAGSLSHTNASCDESCGQALGASKAGWGDACNHIQDITPVCVCMIHTYINKQYMVMAKVHIIIKHILSASCIVMYNTYASYWMDG